MRVEDKIILDLCGGTGAWSKPYADAGYDVRIITLPEYDVKEYHPPGNVYGILAAPPCTEFSFARTNKKQRPTDFLLGLELIYACQRIIHEAIILQWENHTIFEFKFWALENPAGYLRRFMGEPVFIFNPSDFGDMWTKRTHLWGVFKKPVKLLQGVLAVRDYTDQVRSPGKRAITPPGFAYAFSKANK